MCMPLQKASISVIHVLMYHVSFLGEDAICEALQSHPLDWQLHLCIYILPEVVLGIHILCETKVRHFYKISIINPVILIP